MCCQYYFDVDDLKDILSLTGHMMPDTEADVKSLAGEVHPADAAPVVTGAGSIPKAEIMRWGFPAKEKGKLMINARSETALAKPSFSESVLKRRCIITAGRFYEWDRHHQKAQFTRDKKAPLYMAGFYQWFQDEFRFIVLTTAANGSMIRTHDRMPLILDKSDVTDWLYDDRMVGDLLKKTSPELVRYQQYEQLSLFDGAFDLKEEKR